MCCIVRRIVLSIKFTIDGGGFLRIYPVGLDVVAQCLGLLGRSKDPILDKDY